MIYLVQTVSIEAVFSQSYYFTAPGPLGDSVFQNIEIPGEEQQTETYQPNTVAAMIARNQNRFD